MNFHKKARNIGRRQCNYFCPRNLHLRVYFAHRRSRTCTWTTWTWWRPPTPRWPSASRRPRGRSTSWRRRQRPWGKDTHSPIPLHCGRITLSWGFGDSFPWRFPRDGCRSYSYLSAQARSILEVATSNKTVIKANERVRARHGVEGVDSATTAIDQTA